MVLLLLVSTIFNLTWNELILECTCGFNLFLFGFRAFEDMGGCFLQ